MNPKTGIIIEQFSIVPLEGQGCALDCEIAVVTLAPPLRLVERKPLVIIFPTTELFGKFTATLATGNIRVQMAQTQQQEEGEEKQ
jgi:hypothetical protein